MKLRAHGLVPVLLALVFVGGIVAAKAGYGKEKETMERRPVPQEQEKKTMKMDRDDFLTLLFGWLTVRSGTVPGPVSRSPDPGAVNAARHAGGGRQTHRSSGWRGGTPLVVRSGSQSTRKAGEAAARP